MVSYFSISILLCLSSFYFSQIVYNATYFLYFNYNLLLCISANLQETLPSPPTDLSSIESVAQAAAYVAKNAAKLAQKRKIEATATTPSNVSAAAVTAVQVPISLVREILISSLLVLTGEFNYILLFEVSVSFSKQSRTPNLQNFVQHL